MAEQEKLGRAPLSRGARLKGNKKKERTFYATSIEFHTAYFSGYLYRVYVCTSLCAFKWQNFFAPFGAEFHGENLIRRTSRVVKDIKTLN